MADQISVAQIQKEDIGDNIVIVHISGKLDESNSDIKFQEVYGFLNEAQPGMMMIMELSNLEYLNSRSIGYLIDVYNKLLEKGGNIAFVAVRPNVVDILNLVGVSQLVQFFNTIEEAKTYLLSGESSKAVNTETAEKAPLDETPVQSPQAQTAPPINPNPPTPPPPSQTMPAASQAAPQPPVQQPPVQQPPVQQPPVQPAQPQQPPVQQPPVQPAQPQQSPAEQPQSPDSNPDVQQ